MLNVTYVVGLIVSLHVAAAGSGFDYGLPTGLRVLLWAPLVLAALTAMLIGSVFQSSRRRFWSPTLRLALTSTSIACLLLLAILKHWNLIGS